MGGYTFFSDFEDVPLMIDIVKLLLNRFLSNRRQMEGYTFFLISKIIHWYCKIIVQPVFIKQTPPSESISAKGHFHFLKFTLALIFRNNQTRFEPNQELFCDTIFAVPMNKIVLGKSNLPNLKNIKSKVGSMMNSNYKVWPV